MSSAFSPEWLLGLFQPEHGAAPSNEAAEALLAAMVLEAGFFAQQLGPVTIGVIDRVVTRAGAQEARDRAELEQKLAAYLAAAIPKPLLNAVRLKMRQALLGGDSTQTAAAFERFLAAGPKSGPKLGRNGRAQGRDLGTIVGPCPGHGLLLGEKRPAGTLPGGALGFFMARDKLDE